MSILLTREEVAALLCEAQDVQQRLQDKNVHSRRSEGTVPLGTITCGELIRMNRGLMLLAWQLFPELESPEVVEQFIRNAVVAGAGGSSH